MTGDARNVTCIRAGDGLEHKERVFDGAGHGAEFIEGPAESHRTGAGHSAVGWAQSGDAAAHAGADDAATGFAADGKADEACRGGGPGTGARARCSFFQEPRVHRLSAKPNIVEGKRAKAELGEEHSARGVKALDDGGVIFRNAIAERLGAIGGGDSGGVQKILAAPRNA